MEWSLPRTAGGCSMAIMERVHSASDPRDYSEYTVAAPRSQLRRCSPLSRGRRRSGFACPRSLGIPDIARCNGPVAYALNSRVQVESRPTRDYCATWWGEAFGGHDVQVMILRTVSAERFAPKRHAAGR